MEEVCGVDNTFAACHTSASRQRYEGSDLLYEGLHVIDQFDRKVTSRAVLCA